MTTKERTLLIEVSRMLTSGMRNLLDRTPIAMVVDPLTVRKIRDDLLTMERALMDVERETPEPEPEHHGL